MVLENVLISFFNVICPAFPTTLIEETAFFSLIFFIEVQLIYNVVLTSNVQQKNIYISFFRLFSIIGYHKILSRVPCIIQQVLVVYLFYIQQCLYVNPKLLIYLPLQPCSAIPFGNHKFDFYVCESISVLYISSFVSFFLDSTSKLYHMIFVFLTYFI